jgi:hypothetical protein
MEEKLSLKQCEIYKNLYLYRIGAFDREQAIELFKEDFKNDKDLDKVRITRIASQTLEKGDKIYAIFFRLDGSQNLNKPLCVECGSNEVISKGMSWYCKACGRWFLKIRRGSFNKRIGDYVKDNLGIEYFGALINGYHYEILKKIAEHFSTTPQQVISALKDYLSA